MNGNWVVLRKNNINTLCSILGELTDIKGLNSRDFVRIKLLYLYTNRYKEYLK